MATENVMGFEPAVCEKKLKEHPETQPVCTAPHCESFQETELYHADCVESEKAIYSPVQTYGCYNKVTKEWKWDTPKKTKALCKELEKQDPNWELEECFCCCACFANQTPIGLPEGIRRPIAEIGVGDKILAGSVSGGKVEWEATVVHFSQGTEEGRQPAMAYLVYGDGEELISSPDQPLMLADGTLTTAGRLAPGDKLMGVDGEPVVLSLVSIGEYKGGVHHIATETEWHGSIDEHLIQANGVVAGDFTLQLFFPQIASDLKVADWESLPEVGTASYQTTYSNLMQVGGSEVFAEENSDISIDNEAFTAYGAESDLPLGTQTWITPAQAADLLQNGVQAPVADQSSYSLAAQAIALVRGFYPGFTYYLEWNRTEPNLYAFEQYGQKVILLSGGLVRMQGIGFNGLAMVLGHGIGRFLGGRLEGSEGSETLACTGAGDLYGFGIVSRKIWFGKYWLKQVTMAEEQVKQLFALIAPKHAKANPHNICEEPGIACREETWEAETLPECAGGEPPTPLTLEKASVTGAGEVQLVFSQALEAGKAEAPSSYALKPEGTVEKASIDPKRNFIVDLQTAGLKPGKYTLTCSGLQSMFGGKLRPDPSSIEFEVAE